MIRPTRAVIAIVVATSCALLLAVAITVGSVRPSVEDAALAFEPHPGARLPLRSMLVDESGRAVALGEYFGKSPVIVVLSYLRCTSLCGVTLRNLIRGSLNQSTLKPGRDYQLVAISIDPRDRPADAAAALSQYRGLLERREASDGMHVLTGSRHSVREIADVVGFPFRYDAALDTYVHPAGYVIATPNGSISRYVEGVDIQPSDLLFALRDARAEQFQSPLTRILLLCRSHVGALGGIATSVLAALTIANIAAIVTLMAVFTAVFRQRHG